MTDLICLNLPYEYPFKINNFSRPSRSPSKTRGGTLYYPVSLSLMTSYAKRFGFSSRIYDCITDDYSVSDVLKIVEKHKPKVVVIDTSTPSFVNDRIISDMIQERNKHTKVVLVGRHVTYAPTESLKSCKKVRVVARHEFYSQVIDLLEGKDLSQVDGISYRDNGNIVHNKDAKFIHPDEMGFISKIYKSQLSIKKYFYASIRNPYIMLLAGAYSCPYNCSFCNEYQKGNYRHRSVDNIIQEIKWIRKNLPYVKEILWDDPTFVVDENFIKELSEAIIKNKIEMRWSCMTRANISYDTLKVMKESGFKTAHIGLESSNQGSLNAINKNMEFDSEVEYLKRCEKLGIYNHGCFIVGLPGDTKESVKATIDKAKSLPALDSVQVFPLIPTPFEDIFNEESKGTIWRYLIDNNYLTTRDYSKWLKPNGLYNVVVNYPHLSSKEIEELVERFYRSFYFRRGYIWYKLKQSLSSYQELKRNVRGFKTMVSK